jgi:hypothetical protein
MSKASVARITTSVPHASAVQWLAIEDLRIDPEAQRDLRVSWVKQHVQKFDADQLGYIVVNIRRDGHHYVIDGQHRVELLRAVGWGDQKVSCEVFTGLSQKEEAALFLSRNDRLAVRTFDKFRVRITAGEPVATDINRIVLAASLSLAQATTGSGHVSAVTALERIYRGGGIAGAKDGASVLARTLRTIEQAWGRESTNFEGQVIEGVGLTLTRYGTKLEQAGLVSKLSKIGGGAAGLIGKARGMRDMRGGTVAYCIAGLIVERYNRGRRGGKLDGWWS